MNNATTSLRIGGLLPRLVLVAGSWLYALALHFAHGYFLRADWDYYGFTYVEPGPLAFWLMMTLVTVAASVLPTDLRRPSSLVLLFLFEVVFVPAVVLSLSLHHEGLARYGTALVALTSAIVIASIAARACAGPAGVGGGIPGERATAVFVAVWMVSALILVANYGSIMSFATPDRVYEQRAAGAASGALMSYLRTYFSNVFSPVLVALGLVQKRRWLVALGALGCLLTYMIDAQRTVFLLPVAMLVQYAMLTSRRPLLRTGAPHVIGLAALVLVASANFDTNPVTALLSVYIVFRTLGIPGLSFSQYADFFGNAGYTWWSHVKGIDLLVAPPAALAGNDSWPRLGYVVGEYVYNNVENNVNANLFSGDGVAAAGALGVLVIGLVLALWLVMLDRVSRGWDRTFAALVILPVGLSLTNGHLFTTLLSFGGLFWLLVFHFHKPAATDRK